MPKIDISTLIGKKYNFLTILNKSPRQLNGKYFVQCLCECGSIKDYYLFKVKTGHTKSCGCYKGNKGKNFETHGLSHHPLYEIWSNILFRCYNPNSSQYKDYGGRGVIMCDKWKGDFKIFYDWCIQNGWQKRLVVDKDIKAKLLGVEPLLYSPDRCSIITHKQNSNCTQRSYFIEYKGEIKTASEWAKIYNLRESTIRYRINNNWPLESVFTVLPHFHNRLLK